VPKLWATCALGLDCIRGIYNVIRLPIAEAGDAVNVNMKHIMFKYVSKIYSVGWWKQELTVQQNLKNINLVRWN